MGTNELLLIVGEAPESRQFRTHSEPWFGRALLGGPKVFLGHVQDGEPYEHVPIAASTLILDPGQHRALVDAQGVYRDEPELERAFQAVAVGLWRALGWQLQFVSGLKAEFPDSWPEASSLAPVGAGQARALWEHLGDWQPLRSSVPDASHLDDLPTNGFSVSFNGTMPVLVSQGSARPTPRAWAYAFACAVASERFDAADGRLRPSHEWIGALPDPSTSAEVPRLQLHGPPIPGVPEGVRVPMMGCHPSFLMFPGEHYTAKVSGESAYACKVASSEGHLVAVFREAAEDGLHELGVLVRIEGVTRIEDDEDGTRRFDVPLTSLCRVLRADNSFSFVGLTPPKLEHRVSELISIASRGIKAFDAAVDLLERPAEERMLPLETTQDLGRLIDGMSDRLLCAAPKARMTVFETIDVHERLAIAVPACTHEAEGFEEAYANLAEILLR